MKREERYAAVVAYFRQTMPNVQTELDYQDNFQLLVAVILSAQCTDKRVNMVTPALFERYPTAIQMSEAKPEEVYTYIRSVTYPNAKALHLVEMSKMLVERHGGEVPHDFDELLRLPGVGRKTANVIQAVAFGQAAMAVDTHVYRVSHRLGLVSRKDDTPLKVERTLMKNLKAEDVHDAHHWLILHGRYVCTARSPHCGQCGLAKICPKTFF